MGSISNLSSSYLTSVLNSALTSTGANNTNRADTASLPQTGDGSSLSPFAQMMSELQQLQESDPSKYKQVTQQVATNLQTAAQTAAADGNTTAADQLTQLSSDFSKASDTGQLPDMKDLAKAVHGGGGHGHHHHVHAAGSDPDGDGDSTSTTQTSSSGNTAQTLSQLLAAFQTGSTANASLDPTAIIMNTLASAGSND
jgi:hypothetical protein